MKKGLCIILSALMLACSFTACSRKDNVDVNATTSLDENGKAYVNVTDKNGEAVTNKDGETVTSVLSDNEKKNIENASSKNADSTADSSKKSSKDKTKKSDDKSTTLELNSKVIEEATNTDFDLTAAEKDLYEKGTTLPKKTTLFEDKVQKTLKTGKFTIKMNIASGGTKMPMTLAFDKDRMYASFDMNGIQAGILYMNNTAYMLFPNLFKGVKGYMEYPDMQDSMDDIFGSFDKIADNGQKYVGSSKVKDGKTELTCEEYKSEDTVFKYYFKGNDWVRYECIGDEEKMVYEISEFTNKVDDSLFSLKGYTKFDESALAGLMGGM